jgi:hypothetical protein
MRSALAAALVALSSIGCGGDATQVTVVLDGSDTLAASASRLIVVVYDDEGEVAHRSNLALGAEVQLPAQVPVVPRAGDASRAFTLEAVLLDADDATVSRVSTRQTFEADTYREVSLSFPDTLDYETSPGPEALVESFTASGIGTTDVAGATVTVTPPEGEHVLVLVSAQLLGPGGAMGSFVELVVDDRVVSRGEAATFQGQPIQLVAVIEGDGGSHDAWLRLGSGLDRDYTLSDVRIYTVAVPPFADLHFVQGPAETVVGTDWVRVAELPLEPAYPGDYVLLFGAAMSEAPGGSGVNVRFDGASGNYPRNVAYNFGREPALPILAARVDRLEARATVYVVEARVAATMATAFHPVIVAMRADAFPAVVSILDTSPIITRGSEPLSPLSLEAQSAGTHWLAISDTVVRADNADANGIMGITYDRDATQVGERIRGNIAGEHSTIAFIDLFEGSAPVMLESTMSTREGTMECRALESSVVAIRL